MFILYFNTIAIACFCSYDNAVEYMRDSDRVPESECTIDFVPEDEDLWYSINSHA
jgi:hypothetical protein